jgi:hypothetical protein
VDHGKRNGGRMVVLPTRIVCGCAGGG